MEDNKFRSLNQMCKNCLGISFEYMIKATIKYMMEHDKDKFRHFTNAMLNVASKEQK